MMRCVHPLRCAALAAGLLSLAWFGLGFGSIAQPAQADVVRLHPVSAPVPAPPRTRTAEQQAHAALWRAVRAAQPALAEWLTGGGRARGATAVLPSLHTWPLRLPAAARPAYVGLARHGARAVLLVAASHDRHRWHVRLAESLGDGVLSVQVRTLDLLGDGCDELDVLLVRELAAGRECCTLTLYRVHPPRAATLARPAAPWRLEPLLALDTDVRVHVGLQQHHEMRADVRYTTGHHDQPAAVHATRVAFATAADRSQALLHASRTVVETRYDWDEHTAAFVEAWTRVARRPSAHDATRLAQTFEAAGRTAEALRAVRWCLRRHADDPAAARDVAFAHALRRRLETATNATNATNAQAAPDGPAAAAR